MKTARISSKNNGLGKVPWKKVENIFRDLFRGQRFSFTICSNKMKYPSESERLDIMKEYNKSVKGGHQGVTKLYKPI